MFSLAFACLQICSAQNADTSKTGSVHDSVQITVPVHGPLLTLPVAAERLQVLGISLAFLAGAGLYFSRKRKQADQDAGLE